MRPPLISAIFLLSGAAGLIFEVVWSRQLVLVFGNTTQAVSAILTGFFGGMALGGWLGGRTADRVRSPLRLYGYLELALVVVVFLTPISFRLIHEVYRFAFGTLETSPVALSLLRFALALVALAPATMLMGATLPALTRYLARESGELNAAFSRLYVANTLGAVIGAASAGLVLIELVGLSSTLAIGAACSAVAGLAAILIDTGRRVSGAPVVAVEAGSGIEQPGDHQFYRSRFRLALLIAFVSGVTSLGYQILWMRLIASGTGSSTYVFTIVLTLFLTGLGFGAVEYKRIRARLNDVVPLLALGQFLMTVLAVLGMYAINALDDLPGAFVWKAIVAVLPATFVMGFTFPASSALLGGKDSEVGGRTGLLLAANTSGAIIGTFVVPFLLIPAIGSPASLAALAVTNALTGVFLISRAGWSDKMSPRLAVAAALAAAALIIGLGARVFVDPGVVRLERRGAALYRTDEDEIASVQSGNESGQKQLWVAGFSMTVLTVDAKLMPVLPLMLRPASSSLLAIAFGMGSTHRTSVIAGLKTDVVELVPSVPQMFDTFYPDAPQILANPFGRVIIADGRNHVELTAKRYDIVVVDPPPPLESAGVSVISSREFYAASRRCMTPGGVMMQWVPWGQSLDDFKNHVRTFRDVFRHVIVAIGPGRNGFYMLGSEQPIRFDGVAVTEILGRPGVLEDISSASDSPEQTLSGWEELIPRLVRLSGDDVMRFAGAGELITDDRPLPEYFLLKRARSPRYEWLKPEEVRASR